MSSTPPWRGAAWSDDMIEDDGTSHDDSDEPSWITSFLDIEGHEIFSRISESFLRSDFNMNGLPEQVPRYLLVLHRITDDLSLAEYDELMDCDENDRDSDTIRLYGLAHARWICSEEGEAAMQNLYRSRVFPPCPRAYCHKTQTLPIGLSDIPETGSVKFYCPHCQDVYEPTSPFHHDIDGAYFGTTFAHIFEQRLQIHYSSDRFVLPGADQFPRPNMKDLAEWQECRRKKGDRKLRKAGGSPCRMPPGMGQKVERKEGCELDLAVRARSLTHQES